MQPTRVRVLRGPNVYASVPALRAEIAPDGDTPVGPAAARRLRAALPGLAAAAAIAPDATAARVVEHVARELLGRAGEHVPAERPRLAVAPGTVVLPFHSEAAARCALDEATALVAAALAARAGSGSESMDVDGAVGAVRRRVRRSALGPTTRAIVEAAERRGIPWERLDDDSLIRLGQGRHARLVRASITSATSALGADTAQSKELTKHVLRDALVPVPDGVVAGSENDAVEALGDLRAPVVLKPLRGNHGRAVTLDVATPDEARAAYRTASAHGRWVVVEEQLAGRDVRVLVVGGRMVAAAERRPAHVVGDGRQTVAALVAAANADPRRGAGHEAPLTRIALDATAEACLARQGLAPDAVPAAGAEVRLCDAANLSTGGTARDVTDLVHPDVQLACERAARAVGLDICGVDLITADVARPLVAGREGIVEVNAAPGLRMHVHPSEGRPRDAGGAIVSMLFPPGAPSRVPIVAITGTNGKTTTTRLVSHVLRAWGLSVGMTTTSGVWIGDACIARGDTTGPASARAVLADPAVDVAVLETARGGIVRRGLGYSLADVAVVTNVREDHLGQDGMETLDDVIAVKSVVAERVRDGGTLVVNADDDGAMRLLAGLGTAPPAARVVLLTQEPDRASVRRHVRGGGLAYVVRDGRIVEVTASGDVEIGRVDRLPITLGGLADFQVSNVLAAVAACRSLGVPAGAVAEALGSFDASRNEGRFNVYRLGQGHVVLDYGHNPDAFEAIGRLLRRWQPTAPSIGVVKAPGDRSDNLMRASGAAAARAFGTLVLSDDRDRRGRAPGEAVALLREGAAASGIPVETATDETNALRSVLERVRAGAVAVVFYETLAPLVAVLDEAGAVPLARPVSAPSVAESLGRGRVSRPPVGDGALPRVTPTLSVPPVSP